MLFCDEEVVGLTEVAGILSFCRDAQISDEICCLSLHHLHQTSQIPSRPHLMLSRKEKSRCIDAKILMNEITRIPGLPGSRVTNDKLAYRAFHPKFPILRL